MAMKILIDADGCPVVDLTLQAAAEHGLEAILFCDTSHEFKEKNARVVTVDKALGLESSSKKSVQEEKDIPLRRAAYNNMFLNFIIFVLNLIRNRI